MQDTDEGRDGYEWYEGQPKWPLRRIIKYAAGIISAIVYLIFFIRILGACDNGFAESVILDENEKTKLDAGEISVEKIVVPSLEDDGRIQYEFVTYLPEIENFQLTLKLNSKHHPLKNAEKYGFVIIKTTENGEVTEYAKTRSRSIKRMGYSYTRLVFDKVKVAENDTLTLKIRDGAGKDIYTADVYSSEFYSVKIKNYKITEY